jgi:hypothetical protein
MLRPWYVGSLYLILSLTLIGCPTFSVVPTEFKRGSDKGETTPDDVEVTQYVTEDPNDHATTVPNPARGTKCWLARTLEAGDSVVRVGLSAGVTARMLVTFRSGASVAQDFFNLTPMDSTTDVYMEVRATEVVFNGLIYQNSDVGFADIVLTVTEEGVALTPTCQLRITPAP